jgi:hypothetical protein
MNKLATEKHVICHEYEGNIEDKFFFQANIFFLFRLWWKK